MVKRVNKEPKLEISFCLQGWDVLLVLCQDLQGDPHR